MVNSGSFDSDGDRNGKARCTQASDAATGSQSSDFDVAADTTCKNDCSKSADTDLPSDSTAIEPTASKTEINSSMPTEASSNDEKASLCCSLPLEKIQSALTSCSPPPDNSIGEDKLKRTRKLLCLYCDRSFVSVNLRQKHVERAHTVKPTRRVSARRQNQLSVTTCVHCDKLNVSEHTLNDLFQHLVQEHPTKYFGCVSCEERFLTSTHLVDHNSSKHSAEENINIKRHSPTAVQMEEIDVDSLQDTDDVPLKITRSKLRNKPDDPLNVVASSKMQKRKKKSKLKELRNKKISVKTSKIALKRSKRLQAQTKEGDSQKKRREKKLVNTNKSEASNSTKQPEKPKPICVNPYPEFDNFYRVKKITDHSIDNLKISSLTFDDVFDKAFFNRIKCNIEENLLHHIDGKLFKNEESESRISNFEKISANPQEIQTSTSENYGCELSLNAITPVPSLSLNSQFGEDFESQIEYGSKPSKKKTQTKSDEVHYKYFTRRKYQASILQQKENRDLSKLDMWTQMVVKERQEKLLNKKKNAKEIQEYTSGQEYKNKMKREELNRILDRRGPFEDLKEEASKKAAFDKLNSSSDSDISQEVFTDVRAVLNEILNKVFEAVEDDYLPEITTVETDHREIPAYLDLRRKDSSTQEEIDRSDRIALICSSQETENYELPTNTVRGKNELVELTGEWARSRMYICAACGGKFSNIKYLLEHRSIYHQNVWVQNYEFVGNQSELYRHLSIPGLGKIGVVEDTIPCKQWKRSDARMCTKCGKQCNSLGELHRHVLECGGDWTWMLARKKCKYRPFGAKSRRKRRGLVPRIHNKRKTEPSDKKNYKKPLEGPRQRPSDADTIQRMLANLPAKRSRRSLISLRDVVFKSRKSKQGNNTQTDKVKCGKTVCKKQKTEVKKPNISQQRNGRSLRSLNKVLSSRILDLNSSLIVKRKLKVIRSQRLTKSNLKFKGNTRDTELKEIENEVAAVNSVTQPPQKRKSPKKCTNNSEGSKIITRISLSDKKKTLTQKMLNSRLNIKSFFPIKKKSIPSLKKNSILDQANNADNNENKTEVEPTKKSIYFENSQNMKKNKRGGLKGFVRALSLRKRNSKYEEADEKNVTVNPDVTNTVEFTSAAVTKKVGRPKTRKLTSLDNLDKLSPTTEPNAEPINVDKGLSKKRKLQRTFRSVINKVKKSKTEKTFQKSDKDASVKNSSKESKTQPFLEEKTLHKAIPPEKVVASAEVQENFQEKEEHVPIVAEFSSLKENSPIPEIIIIKEKSLQANDDPNYCDNEQTDLTYSISPQESMSVTEKIAPVTIDTTLKPKCVPLISPNIKGKIKKPNRGLNDCIAMLTSKLQQKDEKISSSLESLFSTSSTTSMERTESRLLTESISPPVRHQKAECILKIPTFRATKSPVVEETALDLSKKSFSSPNLLFPHSSDVGYIESTINKVIEGVIEHKCKEVLTEKFAAPKWTSVDDIIQQVVQSSSSTIFSKPSKKKKTFNIRTNVDDTIDCVVSGSNWFESKNNFSEEKRKLNKKLRRRKHSDDNLIKDIIFGKDKLIIAPSSTMHNALENSLIAKIKENESKISKISTTSNIVNEHIDKDLGLSLIDSSVCDPEKDEADTFSLSKEKFQRQEPDQSNQTIQIINEPSYCANISLQTLVETNMIVNKMLNSVDNDFITDKKETESQNESFSDDKSAKDMIENTLKDEKLDLMNLVNDKSKNSNINGLLVVKNIETGPFPNNNSLQAIETPKKVKARRKGRGKKAQKQDQPELTTKPVIETHIDDCLNDKLISNGELQPLTNHFPIEHSNLDGVSLINQQMELITESEPLILENKVIKQVSMSLPSDSEDEVPLAIIAKQDENNLQKHSLCQNGKVLQISKNAQESPDLKELQDNNTTESLSIVTPIPKLLEEAILDNEKNNTFSNSCNPLNLNKDIVENLTTDSLKENIEQAVNQNDNQQNYVCNPKVKPLKTHKLLRPMKRKRRKIVFGTKRPSSNKRKNESNLDNLIKATESKNDSLDAEKEHKIHLAPIPPYATSVALDTTEIDSFQTEKEELPEEDRSDPYQETEVCNESVSPLNVSTESVKSEPRSTEINEPVKMLINSQRTRRKSKSSKKIDKFDNDLFKDFSLVINKKTKRIPPTSIVDDSVCDDVLDRGINMLVKSGESGKVDNAIVPNEANELPLIDSVEEMDMEIEDIPINTSIIERDNQQIITAKSYEEKSDILVVKVNSQRPCTPKNEMENTSTRKSPRKKSIPDSTKTCGNQMVENNAGSNHLNYSGFGRGRRNKTDNTESTCLKYNFSVDLRESLQKEGQQLGSVLEAKDTDSAFNNTTNILIENIAKNKKAFLEEESIIIQNTVANFLLIDQKETLPTTSTSDPITSNVVSETSPLPIKNILEKKIGPTGNQNKTDDFLDSKETSKDQKVDRPVDPILLFPTSTPKRNKKGENKNKLSPSNESSKDLNVLSFEKQKNDAETVSERKDKTTGERPKMQKNEDSAHCSVETADDSKTNDILENPLGEYPSENEEWKNSKKGSETTSELSSHKTDLYPPSNSLLENIFERTFQGLTPLKKSIRKSRNNKIFTEESKGITKHPAVLEHKDTFPFETEGNYENKTENKDVITKSLDNCKKKLEESIPRTRRTRKPKNYEKVPKDGSKMAIHENVPCIQSASPSKMLELENEATWQDDGSTAESMNICEKPLGESLLKKRSSRKSKSSVDTSTFQAVLLTKDKSDILEVENILEELQNDLSTNDIYIGGNQQDMDWSSQQLVLNTKNTSSSEILEVENIFQPALKELTSKTRVPRNTRNSSNSSDGDNLSMHSDTFYPNDTTPTKVVVIENINKPVSKDSLDSRCLDVFDKPSRESTFNERPDRHGEKLSADSKDQSLFNGEDKYSSTLLKVINMNNDTFENIDFNINSIGMVKELLKESKHKENDEIPKQVEQCKEYTEPDKNHKEPNELYISANNGSSEILNVDNIDKTALVNNDLNNKLLDVTKKVLEQSPTKRKISRKSKSVTKGLADVDISSSEMKEIENADELAQDFNQHLQEPLFKRKSPRKNKNSKNISKYKVQLEQKTFTGLENTASSKMLDEEHFNKPALETHDFCTKSTNIFQKSINESTSNKEEPKSRKSRKSEKRSKESTELSTHQSTFCFQNIEISGLCVENENILISENISENPLEKFVPKERVGRSSRLKNKEQLSSESKGQYTNKSSLEICADHNSNEAILEANYFNSTDNSPNRNIDILQKHSAHELQYNNKFGTDSTKKASAVENNIEDSGFLERSSEESPNKKKIDMGSKPEVKQRKTYFQENVDSIGASDPMALQNSPETTNANKSILASTSDIKKYVENTSDKITKQSENQEDIYRVISLNFKLSESNNVSTESFDINKTSFRQQKKSSKLLENESLLTSESRNVIDALPATKQLEATEVCENVSKILPVSKNTKRGSKENKQLKRLRRNIKPSKKTIIHDISITDKALISLEAQSDLNTAVETAEQSPQKVKRGRKTKKHQQLSQIYFDSLPSSMNNTIPETKNTVGSLLSFGDSSKLSETGTEEFLVQTNAENSQINLNVPQTDDPLISTNSGKDSNVLEQFWDDTALSLRRSGRNRSTLKPPGQVISKDVSLVPNEINLEDLEKYSSNQTCVKLNKPDKDGCKSYFGVYFATPGSSNAELVSEPITESQTSYCLGLDGAKETLEIDKKAENKRSDKLKRTSEDGSSELSKLHSKTTSELDISESTKHLKYNLNISHDIGKSRRSRKIINYNEDNLEKRAMLASSSESQEKKKHPRDIDTNSIKKTNRIQRNLPFSEKSTNASIIEDKNLVIPEVTKISDNLKLDDSTINIISVECDKVGKTANISRLNDILGEEYLLEKSTLIGVELKTLVKSDKKQRSYSENNFTENLTWRKDEDVAVKCSHDLGSSPKHEHKGKCCHESKETNSENTLNTEQLTANVFRIDDFSEMPKLVVDLELMDREYDGLSKSLAYGKKNTDKICGNSMKLNNMQTNLTMSKEGSENSDNVKILNNKDVLGVTLLQETSTHKVLVEFEVNEDSRTGCEKTSSKNVNSIGLDMGDLDKCDTDNQTTKGLNIFDFEEPVPTTQDMIEHKKSTKRSEKSLSEVTKQLERQVPAPFFEKYENSGCNAFFGRDRRTRKNINYNEEKWEIIESSKPVELISTQDLITLNLEELSSNVKNSKKLVTSRNQKLSSCRVLEKTELVKKLRASELLSLKEAETSQTPGETQSIVRQTRKSRKIINYEENFLNPVVAKTAVNSGFRNDTFDINNDNALGDKTQKQKITETLKLSGKELLSNENLEGLKKLQASEGSRKQIYTIVTTKRGRKQKKNIDFIEVEHDTIASNFEQSETDKIPHISDLEETILNANFNESNINTKSKTFKPTLTNESVELNPAEINYTKETTPNNNQNVKQLIGPQISLTTISDSFFLPLDNVQNNMSDISNKEISQINKTPAIDETLGLTSTYVEESQITTEIPKLKKSTKNIMDIDVANILNSESGSENRRSPRKKRSLNYEKPVEFVEHNIDPIQSHIESIQNENVENKSSLWNTEPNVITTNLENNKNNLTEPSVLKDIDESKGKFESLQPYQEEFETNTSSDSNESIPLLDRMIHFLKNLKNKSDADAFLQNSNSITECVPDYISNSKDSLPIISVSTTDEVFKYDEHPNQNFIDKSIQLGTLLSLTKSGSMEDLILESKSATKSVRSKSSSKKLKGKKKKTNESQVCNATSTSQNEILAESTSILNSNDVLKTQEPLPKLCDQKYQLDKINIKNLLLSSLAAPKPDDLPQENQHFELKNATNLKNSNDAKHRESISVSKNLNAHFETRTPIKSKGKKVKGKKSKSMTSSHNVFQIFDKTLHENSHLNKQKHKYMLGKNVNFTALKNALSTIAKPGRRNKQKKTEVMFSEINPLTDIITSSEMDIAPVLDEIDKSLESEDIYDFNEEEIFAQPVGAKNNKIIKNQTKIRSKSCPNNEICVNVEQREVLHKEPPRINTKRSAKVKALENIHEKGTSELNYFEPKSALDTRRSRRRSKSLNASKEDEIGNFSEDDESKNYNKKSDSISSATINNSFSFQEAHSDNYSTSEHCDATKTDKNSYAKAIEKSSDKNKVLDQVSTKSDDYDDYSLKPNKTKQNMNRNNNLQEILESENQTDNLTDCQELRRSRRGSRKVASYNENDLIDPLIDALENRRNRSPKKDRSEEKHPVKKVDSKDVLTEKPKFNSEELFDILKNSSYENDHLNILKPSNSFLENLTEPASNTDFLDIIDDEFDNILEKPSLTGTEKLKDLGKIYEFTEDSPENTKQVKEFGVNKRKQPTNQENISGETKINSICNNSVENSLSSYASKEKDVEPDKSNYCEICKKTFTRMENLIKHKTTLTHISKLSELEAKEAEERARLENEKQSAEKSSDLLLKTPGSLRDEINIRDILQQSERTQSNTPKNTPSLTNNHPLNLVDIISDVLNKPVLETFNSEKHGYTEMTIQNTEKCDIRRYKSLGERKSFESESQLSRISTPLSESYLPSTMSKTTILENQIHLLENIIGNKLESLAASKAEAENNFIDEVSSCSNNSNLSAVDNNSCASYRSAFNLNLENIQANSHTAFIKPVQYEEISEDSTNARVYDESKLRKTLNRDEELFLECCSLLKSGSEVSNSTYSKNLKKPLNHFKESDEAESLKNKKLIQTVEEAHEYSDNSRTPTPLGDTYDDEASNSNTISSNWNLKSERPLDKNRSFSFEEVVNKEESGISFGEILTKGLRNQFEYVPKSDERTAEEFQEAGPSRSLDLDDSKDDSDCSSTSRKISTKGARKVFEGLKVSIPTEDLNLDVLNSSLINKKSESKDTLSSNENQATIHSKPRSTRKSKPVKKSQVGSNLLFKINKKKASTPTSRTALHKKQDIYNFEETQDNTDVFTKPLFKVAKNTTQEVKDKITALDSDNESLGYADSIGADAKSVSSVSSISAMSTKKPEATPENITKKKYKIMGKIFRNAAKSKVDEIDEELRNIPEIPEIDNLELVKNYVRSCQNIKSPFLPPPPPPPLDELPKKPKMTEEEMSLLFDQLLGKEISESKPEKSISKLSLAKCRADSKTGDIKKKVNKNKIRKRVRANSESSDDEFNINKTAKKRTNKKNNQEDSGINLELELKECIGVASRKSQRKCTSGKQNVLVEYWSSDEEAFEAKLNSQKVLAKRDEEKEKTEPKKCVIKELSENELHSEILAIPTEKPVKTKPAKRKPQPSKKFKTLSNKNPETGGMALTASSRRKRAAANPLYHWSSSSEDESQSLIEVKPVREEDDEEDRPIQHGWIVGDSPKKLVTMLALTKGKKTDIDSVKEQGKRRTSNTVS